MGGGIVPPKVAIAHGNDRAQLVQKSLLLIKDHIKDNISDKRKIIIKPNLGFIKSPLANTEVDTVEEVIKFLRKFYSNKIIIAESTTIGETPDGYRDFGYEKLVNKYQVELVDLNQDDYQDFKIYDANLKLSLTIGLSKTLLHAKYLISVCPIKTHDSVIVTLGIKNIAVAAIKRDDRNKIHGGPKAININLARLAKKIWPSLVVLDGFQAMEGNGPVYGEKKDFRTILAGIDPLAVDTIGAILMGFSPFEIGYLTYLGEQGMGVNDPLKIAVVGENYRKLIQRFKPHYLYHQQLDWKV